MMPKRMFSLWFCLSTVALVGVLSANAQAGYSASKSTDISVFAGYGHINSDFGSTRNNNGLTFGLDFTKYFHLPIVPSLEGRVNLANGASVNERTYLFGPKIGTDILGRFHPYADVLAGFGNIHYNFNTNDPAYVGDNSKVYSYGGGLDVDLIKNVQLKVDYQGQHWNTGQSHTFTPGVLVLGAKYTLPLRKYNRYSDVSR